MSDKKQTTELPINHEEALQLAHFKKDESNLARCYIELHEREGFVAFTKAIEFVLKEDTENRRAANDYWKSYEEQKRNKDLRYMQSLALHNEFSCRALESTLILNHLEILRDKKPKIDLYFAEGYLRHE
jgi:ribosomal protein S18 acetylase RimI-like enzyme